MSNRERLTARVIYNGLGLPRTDGAVVVQGEGEGATIVSLESLADSRYKFPNTPERHVGFALSPAPVNAHTRLDLSTMPFSPGPYESFLPKVVTHSQVGGRGLAAAEGGLAQLEKLGTTVIGDVVTDEAVMRLLLESDFQGVAYWEVIGANPDEADAIFNETVETLRGFKRLERPGGMKVGLAPHTPHTVSTPLLQKLAALAGQNKLPLQIHLAETPGEIAMHKDGTGPLMELCRPFIPQWTPSGLSPVQYLKSLGVLDASPTLIHMVHVTGEDVRDVQKAGCVVVHCPRSNEALACGRFPWELYAKHGVSVALGTDGLGSSPTLSTEDEVKAAQAIHGDAASSQALVWSAVKGGYRALGMQPPQILKGNLLSKFHIWGEENP